VGDAAIDTVGAGAALTSTVAERVAVPPGPVQASVNVDVDVKGPTVSVPSGCLPPDQAPLAVHDVASLLFQLS
jgi:hypothetical protein